MEHVCEVLAAKPRFVRLGLECGETVVVDMSWHIRRHKKILKQHRVMMHNPCTIHAQSMHNPCTLGVSTQPMHNQMLRSFFGMNSTTIDMLINRVRRSATQVTLRQHDILMEVDGKAIRNDNKVLLDNGIPLQLDGFIALKKPGELASLKILRNKDCIVCQSELFVDGWSKRDYASPTYLILGGLVLTEHNFGGVVISLVLEDQINVGYTHLQNAEVTEVNEVHVESMGHVCEVLAAKPRFRRLELECGETVVVDMSWHIRRHKKILKQHRVMNCAWIVNSPFFVCIMILKMSLVYTVGIRRVPHFLLWLDI